MSNLQNKLFFNKYKLQKLIYSSKYSWVYQGINVNSKEPLAIKLEDRNGTKHFLESEAFLLLNLKGLGIPKVISFGKSTQFIILIEELLGLAIHYLMKNKKDKIDRLKNICMIALQIIDRLEFIHSKNIIHRDIKTDNFVIGRNENNKIIYLIDFGFARKYRSSRTGKHIKFKKTNTTMGNLSYISINANKAFEQSRRDDLESLGYMLVFLAKLYLPWSELVKSNAMDSLTKLKKVLQLKLTTTPEQLCKGLPEEFTKYVQYCRGLEFEQDPDYDYLRSLFTSILMKNNQKNDYNFFWVIKSKKNQKNQKNLKKKKNEEDINSFKRRKSSPHIRLYNQIKTSMEKGKTQKRYLTFNNNLLLEHVNSFFVSYHNKNTIDKEEIRDTEKKNILTNSNILTFNNRLIYNYNYLKSKQNQSKNVIDNNSLYANSFNKNNPHELKRINLNKNVFSLQIDDKIRSNSVYYNLIPKQKFNIYDNYMSFLKNNSIKNKNIYKTLLEREKEKENNRSSKLLNNNKKNLLKNFNNIKYINNEMNINKNYAIRTRSNNNYKVNTRFNNVGNRNNIENNSVFAFNKNMNLNNLHSSYKSAKIVRLNTSQNNKRY